MKIKVHGGTAREGEPALCLSCRYASIVQATSANHKGMVLIAAETTRNSRPKEVLVFARAPRSPPRMPGGMRR